MTIIITTDGRRRLAEPWTMREWRDVVQKPWTDEAVAARRKARRVHQELAAKPLGPVTTEHKRDMAKHRDRLRYNGIRLHATGEVIAPLVGDYPLHNLIATNHVVERHGSLFRERIEEVLHTHGRPVGVRVRDQEPIYPRHETLELVRRALGDARAALRGEGEVGTP